MKSIKSAGVIGAGVIGSGWIARLILNGIDVCVFDPQRMLQRVLKKSLIMQRELIKIYSGPHFQKKECCHFLIPFQKLQNLQK
jgi:3-hydroxyacyl-CoA dehydrogenase